MQRLAVAVLQLPEWLTVKGVRIEDAEGAREAPLPLRERDALPPLSGPAIITVDFAPER